MLLHNLGVDWDKHKEMYDLTVDPSTGRFAIQDPQFVNQMHISQASMAAKSRSPQDQARNPSPIHTVFVK